MTVSIGAAAVQKPVTNRISKTLMADNYYGYHDYRYPGQPWENPMVYCDVSPVSLLGSIQTPTLVLVSAADLRTPHWQAKQLYSGLKLRGGDPLRLLERPTVSLSGPASSS